jgi:hypothetical protein
LWIGQRLPWYRPRLTSLLTFDPPAAPFSVDLIAGQAHDLKAPEKRSVFSCQVLSPGWFWVGAFCLIIIGDLLHRNPILTRGLNLKLLDCFFNRLLLVGRDNCAQVL